MNRWMQELKETYSHMVYSRFLCEDIVPGSEEWNNLGEKEKLAIWGKWARGETTHSLQYNDRSGKFDPNVSPYGEHISGLHQQDIADALNQIRIPTGNPDASLNVGRPGSAGGPMGYSGQIPAKRPNETPEAFRNRVADQQQINRVDAANAQEMEDDAVNKRNLAIGVSTIPLMMAIPGAAQALGIGNVAIPGLAGLGKLLGRGGSETSGPGVGRAPPPGNPGYYKPRPEVPRTPPPGPGPGAGRGPSEPPPPPAPGPGRGPERAPHPFDPDCPHCGRPMPIKS
jgi:hypothetical protein